MEILSNSTEQYQSSLDFLYFLNELLILPEETLYRLSAYLAFPNRTEIQNIRKGSLEAAFVDLKPNPQFMGYYQDYIDYVQPQLQELILGIGFTRAAIDKNITEINNIHSEYSHHVENLRQGCLRCKDLGLAAKANIQLRQKLKDDTKAAEAAEDKYFGALKRATEHLSQLEVASLKTAANLKRRLLDPIITKAIIEQHRHLLRIWPVFIASFNRAAKQLDRNEIGSLDAVTDRIQANYNEESLGELFLYESDWPPFQKEIENINFSDSKKRLKIFKSFELMMMSYRSYIAREEQESKNGMGYLTILQKLRNTLSKFEKKLQPFRLLEDETDTAQHPLLRQLLSRYHILNLKILNLLRNLLDESTVSTKLEQMIEEAKEFREYTLTHLNKLIKELRTSQERFHVRQFWQDLSYKHFDFVNRILAKNEQNQRALDQTLKNIAGAMHQLAEETYIDLKNINPIFTQRNLKKTQLEYEKSIDQNHLGVLEFLTKLEIYDGTLYEVRRVGDPASKVNQVNEIDFVYPAERVRLTFLVEEGEDHSHNLIEMTEELKKLKIDNPETALQLDEEFEFFKKKDPPIINWQKLHTTRIQNRIVIDVANIILTGKPCTIDGVTKKNFRRFILDYSKDKVISEPAPVPTIEDLFKKGSGYTNSVCKQYHPFPAKIPMMPEGSDLTQDGKIYLLSPTHLVQIFKNSVEGVPNSSEFFIATLLNLSDDGKDLTGDWYYTIVWRSSPMLRNVIETNAGKETTRTIKKAAEFFEKAMEQTDPKDLERIAAARAAQLGGGKHAEILRMKREFEEEVFKRRVVLGEELRDRKTEKLVFDIDPKNYRKKGERGFRRFEELKNKPSFETLREEGKLVIGEKGKRVSEKEKQLSLYVYGALLFFVILKFIL